MSVAETCIAARDRLKPLMRYGEESVRNPAQAAHEALAEAANSVTALVAACKALDAALCDGFDTQAQRMAGRKALIAARAAIAKATGQSTTTEEGAA